MRKTNSVVGVKSFAQAGNFEKLSQAEMEDELDHCPAPWKCPDVCYIDRLKQMNANNGNKSVVDWEMKDRKTAFGMATKLVFSLYVDRGRNPATTESFWRDVYKFFKQYEEKQELLFREKAAM